MIRKINRKNISVVLLLVLLFTIGVTLAYSFSQSNGVENIINVGTVDTVIDEGEVTIKDAVIKKSPCVKNVSGSPALVRVRLIISPENMVSVDNDGSNNSANLKINTRYWEYNEYDQYYYYQGVLDGVNSQTEPLFNEITGIIDGNGNFLENKDAFNVTIYQESIQTSARDKNGIEYDAYEGFVYNKADATSVWQIYKDLKEMN